MMAGPPNGYVRFFERNPGAIQDIIEARVRGKSLWDIAKRYGVSHSTVIYHLRKHARILAVRGCKSCGRPLSEPWSFGSDGTDCGFCVRRAKRLPRLHNIVAAGPTSL